MIIAVTAPLTCETTTEALQQGRIRARILFTQF